MDRCRVLVIDDDPYFRSGLIAELSEMDDVSVAGSAASLDEALEFESPGDVVLLDLGLPGSCRRNATEDVLRRWPSVRVLIITAYASGPDVVQAFAEGARGYVTKTIRPRDLRDALIAVASGRSCCTPTLAGQLLNVGMKLTVAERAVLRLVAEGLADKQVATTLGTTQRAVENRLANVRLKAGLLDRSRSNITKFAIEADPSCQLTPEEHLADDRRRRRVSRLGVARQPVDPASGTEPAADAGEGVEEAQQLDQDEDGMGRPGLGSA